MRGTYVMRNGELVLKAQAGPRHGGVHVISDDLGQDLEHHGYSDGRKTASKSEFRRWTRDAGLVEKGIDRLAECLLGVEVLARHDMRGNAVFAGAFETVRAGPAADDDRHLDRQGARRAAVDEVLQRRPAPRQ